MMPRYQDRHGCDFMVDIDRFCNDENARECGHVLCHLVICAEHGHECPRCHEMFCRWHRAAVNDHECPMRCIDCNEITGKPETLCQACADVRAAVALARPIETLLNAMLGRTG